MTDEPYMTVRDMVKEIREDVKGLKEAMPSQAQVADHEDRIRGLERFRYAIPGAAVISAGVATVSALAAVFYH